MEQLRVAFHRSPRCTASQVNYGTAGFRSKAENLSHVMFRCGVLATLRSISHAGQAVGVCITASHNPEEDNGIKIVEPDGGMLSIAWEKYASDLVNCGDDGWQAVLEAISVELFHAGLEEILSKLKFSPWVVVARDTRTSSPELATHAINGIRAMSGRIVDCKEATTPMLHWAVTYVNDRRQEPLSNFASEILHKAYYGHFTQTLETCVKTTSLHSENMPQITAYCDAAGGVGGPCIRNFSSAFKLLNIDLNVINEQPSAEIALNDHCGAEHVQKQRQLPRGAEKLPPNSHCFAMDGDADRVVFFSTPGVSEAFQLLDGDRLAAIATATLVHLWQKLVPKLPEDTVPLSIGVIQTAYANGGSTKFLEQLAKSVEKTLSMSIRIAKTGVKNVYKLAVLYDVGIWFESNGHGTISPKFKKIDQWAKDHHVTETSEWMAIRTYLGAYNWCVGDAMVDALCFELSLRILKLDLPQACSYYPDLEVVQLKKPMNRAKLDLLKAHPEHELWLVSPTDIQDKINVSVQLAGPNARAFIRASGTEDVCRIYAEASTLEAVKTLAKSLTRILEEFDSA